MPPNFFHNWGHIYNVFSTSWRLVVHGRLREDGALADSAFCGGDATCVMAFGSLASRLFCVPLLCSVDVFSLLLAALCHDLQHPGNTNAYELATQSELSTRYNDCSPLESAFRNLPSTFCLPFSPVSPSFSALSLN